MVTQIFDVPTPGDYTQIAHIFIYNIVHCSEHYGVIPTCLRRRGVIPPSSALDERPAAGGSAAR
jgi:hypothetical protein